MSFDKVDMYIVEATIFVTLFLVVTLYAAIRGRMPSVQTLTELAALFNTKGGIVIMLMGMWFVTLFMTVAFGIWVIVRGVDPQHAVVITILGMLISQAFGNVNGALFKTMVGEDPPQHLFDKQKPEVPIEGKQ